MRFQNKEDVTPDFQIQWSRCDLPGNCLPHSALHSQQSSGLHAHILSILNSQPYHVVSWALCGWIFVTRSQ
jgi:hypothetical protein